MPRLLAVIKVALSLLLVFFAVFCYIASHESEAAIEKVAASRANRKSSQKANSTSMEDEMLQATTRSVNASDPVLYLTDGSNQISRKNHLIFVHLPKTGGSTIESSHLFEDARLHHRIGGHSSITAMMKNAHERGLGNFVSFALIRHPCSRFISAVNYLASKKGNNGDQKFVDEHIHGMDLPEVVDVMESSTPEGERLRSWLHFLPMHEFLFFRTGEFGVTKLFCQESFADAVTWLNKNYNNSYGEPESRLELPHQQCSDLSEETRTKIETVYAMDYCIFDYKTGNNGVHATEVDGCPGGRFSADELTKRYATCRAKIVPRRKATPDSQAPARRRRGANATQQQGA